MEKRRSTQVQHRRGSLFEFETNPAAPLLLLSLPPSSIEKKLETDHEE